MKPKSAPVFSWSGKTRGVVLAVFLSILFAWICLPERVPALPAGNWQSEDGHFWMKTDDKTVAIGRRGDKSSFSKLPNRAHRGRVYALDDYAKAHPQRLRILKDGSVEWRREASGPSPEYRAVFVQGEEGQ